MTLNDTFGGRMGIMINEAMELAKTHSCTRPLSVERITPHRAWNTGGIGDGWEVILSYKTNGAMVTTKYLRCIMDGIRPSVEPVEKHTFTADIWREK